MNVETILGVVRHVLTAVAGFLVTKGVIETGQVEIVVGSVVGLLGVAWSIWAKRKAA